MYLIHIHLRKITKNTCCHNIELSICCIYLEPFFLIKRRYLDIELKKHLITLLCHISFLQNSTVTVTATATFWELNTYLPHSSFRQKFPVNWCLVPELISWFYSNLHRKMTIYPLLQSSSHWYIVLVCCEHRFHLLYSTVWLLHFLLYLLHKQKNRGAHLLLPRCCDEQTSWYMAPYTGISTPWE